MILKSAYTKAKQALIWNGLSTITYKLLILAHQAALFYVLPKKTYGTIGIVFATLYSIIAVTHFGFDYSLFPIFHRINTCQKIFWYVIKQAYIRCISAITVGLAFAASAFWIEVYPLTIIPKTIIFYCTVLIIAELIKKPLITSLYLSFLNKQAFYIEAGCLTIYFASVWIWYGLYNALTMDTVIGFLAVITTLEISIMLFFIYKKICTLTTPQHAISRTIPSIQSRVLDYYNQLVMFACSPNMLLLIAATKASLAHTATTRIILNIVSFFYAFSLRTIALVIGTSISDIMHTDPNQKPTLFKKIYVPHILASVLVSGIIAYATHHYSNIPYTLYIILGICTIEYIIMPLEKVYISTNQNRMLAAANTIGIFSGGCLYWVLPIALVTCILFARIVTLLYLVAKQHEVWSPNQAS